MVEPYYYTSRTRRYEPPVQKYGPERYPVGENFSYGIKQPPLSSHPYDGKGGKDSSVHYKEVSSRRFVTSAS